MTVIAIVGVITLFFGGLLALVQDDLKKVLAYSTISQLGYMVAAIGVGGYAARSSTCSPTGSSRRCCSSARGP
jgi:NADH-quinone oxidoreductase subunit L